MARVSLNEILVSKGYVTENQIKEAEEQVKLQGEKNLTVGEYLVSSEVITENQLLEAVAKRYGYPIVDLTDYKIDETIFEKIPRQLAIEHSVASVFIENDVLIVALSDPTDLNVIEDIKAVVKMPIKFKLGAKSKIEKLVSSYYSERNVQDAANKASETISSDSSDGEKSESVDDSAPVVALVNSILLKAYMLGASDIHIEPFEQHTYVRLRIDGMLIDYINIRPQLHSSIVTRIKVLSDLDIAEKRIPQDGQIKIVIEGKEMNIRVSTLPMIYGEKIVMRFLNSETKLDNTGTFGMNEYNYEKIERIMQHPNGVIYITGPTGSGKTTTLYMMMEKIAKGPINVSTIEDPVERPLARINQTQVNAQAGMTFAKGLRALLRQDPDVILVGETRDGETASIGVTAAITGHLVLSTLHTNDAISSITRLEDMGVEYYMLASAVKGIVAQRLMKKICPKCKEEYVPTKEDEQILGEKVPKLWRGKGCEFCNGTGYKGRISIHEILEVDSVVREMIGRNAPLKEISDYVIKNDKMHTLKHEAVELAKQGITTVDEVIKVAYTD